MEKSRNWKNLSWNFFSKLRSVRVNFLEVRRTNHFTKDTLGCLKQCPAVMILIQIFVDNVLVQFHTVRYCFSFCLILLIETFWFLERHSFEYKLDDLIISFEFMNLIKSERWVSVRKLSSSDRISWSLLDFHHFHGHACLTASLESLLVF